MCAWTVTRHRQTVTVYPSAPAPQTVTVYPSAQALQIVTMYPSAPAPVTVYPFTPDEQTAHQTVSPHPPYASQSHDLYQGEMTISIKLGDLRNSVCLAATTEF